MYQTPEVLDKEAHGKLTYTAQNKYGYARSQTIAPLLSEEVLEDCHEEKPLFDQSHGVVFLFYASFFFFVSF